MSMRICDMLTGSDVTMTMLQGNRF
eukprot:CCRYP_010844-RA/>CCRYP_010844-RA protein AED:0.47 eAED:1.00 QI:0/-1/0/1/-1/0/1/0/24